MRVLTSILMSLCALPALMLGSQLAQAQAQVGPVTVAFEQTGFSGGKVSGYIRGTDLDGDGRLYSASTAISGFLGEAFGNEVERASITFKGFGLPAPVTLNYDKSVADMADPVNTFMAFAYNLDGGALGDDPDEGISFAVYSPSINYAMGERFSPVWYPFILQDAPLTTCQPGLDRHTPCATVLYLTPDADSPTGVAVEQAWLSHVKMKTRTVGPWWQVE